VLRLRLRRHRRRLREERGGRPGPGREQLRLQHQLLLLEQPHALLVLVCVVGLHPYLMQRLGEVAAEKGGTHGLTRDAALERRLMVRTATATARFAARRDL